jgi:hypothetical protein
MKHLLFLSAFLLTFIISNPLPAQTGEWAGKFSLQLLGGSHIPVGDWGKDVAIARAFGGKLSYHKSDMWVTDVTLINGGFADFYRIEAIPYGFPKKYYPTKIRGQKRASYLLLNQIRYLMRGSVRPYVVVGFGIYRQWDRRVWRVQYQNMVTYHSAKERDALGFNVGMGVEDRINDIFSVVMEARYHKVPNALDMFTVSAGLNVLGPDMKPVMKRVKQYIKKHRQSRFSIQLGGGAAVPFGNWADGANLGGMVGGSFQYDMFSRYSIALSGLYSPRVKTDSWEFSANQEYSGQGGGIIVGSVDGTAEQFLSHYHLSIDHLVYLKSGKARPYVMLGTGYYKYRNIEEKAAPNPTGGLGYSEHKVVTEHFGTSAGLGLDIRIHPMATLVTGVRYHWTHKDRQNELNMRLLSIKAGINFYAN